MNNFKISTRLIILIGMMSVLLVAIGNVGLFGISKSNDALKTVYEDRTVATGQIASIQRDLLDIRLAIADALITPTPEVIKTQTAAIDVYLANTVKVITAFKATKLTTREMELIKTCDAAYGKLLQEGMHPALAALLANDVDEAHRLMAEKVHPLYQPLSEGIEALLQLQLDEAKKEYEAAVASYATIRMLSIFSIMLGVLFAVLFGLALVRGISRSLKLAMDASNAVAQSDLTHTIHIDGKDEVAQLLISLSVMKDSLIKIVSQVRNGSDTIAIASSQIAAGNMDLSSRTEEQASSLEETAASMEELTGTVKKNADNARQANHLAVSASDVAVRGGAVVAQVVDTMALINDSSKKIVDIIGVIDSIAFQTNILALNAAVEAARAGEQGRGFAVVASEVRNLAQRSAAAAKEIKALIGDSVDKVTAGSRLVDEAGKTMDEVVTSVRRVTDIMSEITAASQEQSAGIEQVNQAITQMDEVTQKNASLVEQAAAAAESLQDQARNLSHVVSVFQLDGMHAAAATTSATRSRPAARTVAPVQRITKAAPTHVALTSPFRRSALSAAVGADDWEKF